jgi:hypothetical protein
MHRDQGRLSSFAATSEHAEPEIRPDLDPASVQRLHKRPQDSHKLRLDFGSVDMLTKSFSTEAIVVVLDPLLLSCPRLVRSRLMSLAASAHAPNANSHFALR